MATTFIEIGEELVYAYIDEATGEIIDPRGKKIDENSTSFPMFYPEWNKETRKVEPRPATKLNNPTSGTFWEVLDRCTKYNDKNPRQFPGFNFTFEMGEN